MSTFLTLCQEMRAEAGISGTGPTTVVGQTGIHLRIVNAIRDAWLRIQNNPKEWKWMWRDGLNIHTIENTPDYVLTDVGKIHTQTFTAFKTSVGGSSIYPLTYMGFDAFNKKYATQQTVTAGKPTVVTQLPNGNLRLYPVPNDIYTLNFEYQKTAQVLTGNDDVPEMPAQFHELIQHEAMLKFGGLDDAPEVLQTAAMLKQSIFNDLIWDQELKRQQYREVRAE